MSVSLPAMRTESTKISQAAGSGAKAEELIDSMVRSNASEKSIDESALRPCWKKQTMRIVAPVSDPDKVWPPMEWRLEGIVTTMGELLLQLGDTKDLPVAC